MGNLTINLLNLPCTEYADFVKIDNKWSEIDSEYKCCYRNCINTEKPIGNCIKGFGFGNIIDDENIKYVMGKGGYNKCVFVSAENPFNKPQICSNYSLYYFEIKCKIKGELNNVDKFMNRIGIRNSSTTEYVRYSAKFATHFNEQEDNATNFNNNDIFGFGLVYPPTNKMKKEFPYTVRVITIRPLKILDFRSMSTSDRVI